MKTEKDWWWDGAATDNAALFATFLVLSYKLLFGERALYTCIVDAPKAWNQLSRDVRYYVERRQR